MAQARKSVKSPPPRRKQQPARDWFEVVVAYAGLLAKLSMVAFVVALGYIVYAVYGGYLDTGVDPRILRNVEWMGKLLAVAGFVGTLALAIATIDEVAYTVAAGIVGLGLILGTPVLIVSKLHNTQSEAGLLINDWTRNAGFAIGTVAALRVIYFIAETVRSGPKARLKAQQEEDERLGPKKVKVTSGIWSKCWNLPYCHDTIREVCPAYKERKTCWKFGRGCNCDPLLVETMIRAGAARVGKGQDKVAAQKQITQDEYMRELLGAGSPGKGPSPGERTIDCKKCPIYGEHQRQKFNLVNPIAILLTLAGLAVAYPVLKQFYNATILSLAKGAHEMAFQSASVERWIGYLNTPTVQVFFFFIVTLFSLSYVLKIVEWAIFVKKV
ncbi:MAG: hypothetical protein ACUVX8_05410 [Candidatus Zipacnadales bacterium]